MSKIKKFLNKRTRTYVYGVCLASGPVLVHYDLVEPEALPLFLGFALALLNLKEDPQEGA